MAQEQKYLGVFVCKVPLIKWQMRTKPTFLISRIFVFEWVFAFRVCLRSPFSSENSECSEQELNA